MKSRLLTEKHFHSAETRAILAYMEGPPSGPPLVLIHGVTSRWQPFQPILPTLAENHQVYALDLRGHGRSSHTPSAYRLDDYTRDVYQFIMHCVRKPVTVYGHSLGALVAINLAAQHPADISALILGDPPLYYHNTSIQDTVWHQAFIDLLEFLINFPNPAAMDSQLQQIAPNMSPERREERVRSLETLDPDVVQSVISNELMNGVSLTALAHRVACPVLLLRGSEELGSALRAQDVDFAVTSFSDIRVLNMETIGHGIIPATLLPQMVEFIDSAKSIQENLSTD